MLLFLSFIAVSKSGAFSSSSVEIIDTATQSGEVKAAASENVQITIEVAGAVHKPGVYALSVGSRVQDALLLAGDILPTADTVLVEKTVNKAAKLVDGQKIYIPKKGDDSSASIGADTPNAKLININTGSQSELESLPGVGPATATKIITGRPYGSLEDLTAKKAVSASVFEKIKDVISLY